MESTQFYSKPGADQHRRRILLSSKHPKGPVASAGPSPFVIPPSERTIEVKKCRFCQGRGSFVDRFGPGEDEIDVEICECPDHAEDAMMRDAYAVETQGMDSDWLGMIAIATAEYMAAREN